jgi:autotransporter-associated beta strand protein
MKKIILLIYTLLSVLVSGTTMAQSFVHPGLLHTQVDLDRMKVKVAAGAQPWQSGWDMLVANSHSSLTRPHANVPDTIYRGFDGVHPENYALLFRDAASMYATALRWKISGDTAYAEKSIAIMNAWSAKLKVISGTSDRFLLAGIQGYQLANAAEIMRSYSGWATADFERFKNMMLTIFYAMNHDFLVRHNGACISHYWANWDLCNMASMLSIGVLCDRRDIYDEAIDYFKNGAGNGAIQKLVPFVHGDLAQWQESGRDQGHTVLGVALAGSFCEMAWNQGEDLYGYDDNRLLKGFEYIAKYNLGYEVPYATYSNCDGIVQTIISPNGRGNVRPVWEMVYNHYVVRKSLTAPYISLFAQRVRPEGGGGNYGPNSGGYDQLGYGTLTATIEVPPKPNDQTITFPPIPAKDFGAPDFDPGAIAGSGLPVIYSSLNPNVAAVNADGTIRVLQPGTTIIYAQQLGNDVYNAAPVAQQSISVNKIPGTNDGTWSNTAGTTTNAIASASGSPDLIWPGQSFVPGDHVKLTGTVPGGFGTNTSYTVVSVNATENKIQLSARPAGPPVTAATTIANGTGIRFQKWLNPSNWSGGIVPGGIQATANFGATSFSNIAGVTLDSNITIGTLNYAANGTSELHLASGLNNGQLTFATLSGIPRLTMINTGTRKLFLGNAINNSRIPLRIAGTQGLIINTPVYGGGNPAGLRIQAAMDWSNFSGVLTLEQGTIELHNTTGSATAADNVLLPLQRLNMGTENIAVIYFTGSSAHASNQTIGALDGTEAAFIFSKTAITNGVSTLVVGADNGDGNYEGTIGGGPVLAAAGDRGRIHLEKTGTGTQTISGVIKNGSVTINGVPFFSTVGVNDGKLILNAANEYEGATTVTGGTLQINGSVVSAVTVQAGVLSGSGSSQAPVVLGTGAGPGATIAPGNSVGTFTTTNTLTMNQDAVYALEFNSSERTFDKIITNGVTVNNAVLAITDLGNDVFIPAGQHFVIIDNASDLPVAGAFSGLPEGSVINKGKNSFIISYQGGTGNDIVVSVRMNLQVHYRDGDNNQATNNIIKPWLKILNADSVPIAYKELTARYWLTAENYTGINTWVDYAQLGNSKVKMKYIQADQPHNGAYAYIEYSFVSSAGMLAAGGNSGFIQSRIANQNWSNLDEADDYSYSNNSIYTINEKITLYRNGVLIWGTEPTVTEPVLQVNVLSENKNNNTGANTIRTYLKINNEGNVPVNYEDLSVRYWFTAEGTANLNYWVDFAQLGNSNIIGQFVQPDTILNGADRYFELKVKPSAGVLYPLSSTGNIQYRIAKADWSNFNEANDHSWLPAAPFAANDHITVYYKGHLIYGIEPSAADQITSSRNSKVATETITATDDDVIIYPNPLRGNSCFIKVSNKLFNKDVLIKLYSMDGHMILNKLIRQNKAGIIEIKLERNVGAGLYLIQVNDLPAMKMIKISR